MKTNKGIFFDIGYTLCYPVSNDWRLTKKFFSCIDMDVFNKLSGSKIEYALNSSKKFLDKHHLLWTLEEEYEQNIKAYRIIADCLPELGLTINMIKEIAYDRTYNMGNYCFYDGIKELFQMLSTNYKIGIISDTWPSADNMLRSAAIYDYIDTFTYSCNLGVCKPNTVMFADAIEKMGLAPHDTVFIDDLEENLEAAIAFGINPIMILTHTNKSENKYPSINELSEVKNALSYYFS